MPNIAVLVPRESSNPRLDVVMEAKLHIVGLADFAGGVCDLVFGTLVLDGELSTAKEGIRCQQNRTTERIVCGKSSAKLTDWGR